MAITVAVQKPVVVLPSSATSPTNIFLNSTTANNDGDIVVLSSGGIAPATANQAGNIVGVAQCASNSVWQGFATPNPTVVFGASNLNSGLFSAQPGQVPVIPLGPPNEVIGNLTATTGWVSGGTQQAGIGTQVGLAIDGTTGYYIFDPTASNLVATIQDVDNSVNSAITGGQYQANPTGLLGARVRVVFLPSVLAIQQGE